MANDTSSRVSTSDDRSGCQQYSPSDDADTYG